MSDSILVNILILVVVVACPPLAFVVVIGKLIWESVQENKYK